jgi:hypothetical protein
VLFDFMPIDPAILGFSNPWYPEAARTALRVRLSEYVEIRLIAAPAFIATKLEAFVSRGREDLSSHDLEDVLNVVDGRPSIVDEMRSASDELRQSVLERFRALLAQPNFEDYLPGLLTDGSRAEIVLSRLRGMSV